MGFISLPAGALSDSDRYKLLTGVVVPRPIAWVTTISQAGLVNLAPFSCFTYASNKPPTIVMCLGNKPGAQKDTVRNIQANREFVLNVCDDTMAKQVHQSGEPYPPDVSEIEALGLETLPSDTVAPPRLAASPISLECRLYKTVDVGEDPILVVVGEIVVFHVRDSLYRNGRVDSGDLKPLARLSGPTYGKIGEIIRM